MPNPNFGNPAAVEHSLFNTPIGQPPSAQRGRVVYAMIASTGVQRVSALIALTALGIGWVPACSGGGSASGPAEQTGQFCAAADQCFLGLGAGALRGDVTCLTQLQNGYCTHTCESDSDCCAVPGECFTGLKQVCASFESSGRNYCFLSCESSDIGAAPDGVTTDPSVYCQTWTRATFTCRSTGGGRKNRKFCGP